jgi:WW domain-containing oxidoreductase
MSLYGVLRGVGASGFGYNSKAEEVSAGVDLAGQRWLVTGSTSGIGLETARVLALRGATVWMAARTESKAADAGRSFAGKIIPVACELSDPASVRACVATVRQDAPLDGIVANAGIMALPKLEQKHGYELQFFTNHIGHFLLVTGLMDRLTPAGRVVMLSSAAHQAAPSVGVEFDNLSGERGYSPWRAYGQSKLANLLFARSLAQRLSSGQTANAVHPGVIQTNLGRHMPAWQRASFSVFEPIFLKSVPQGAATQVWAAVNPRAASLRGEYLADCNVARASALGRDDALAARLWTESERIVAAL